MCRYQRCCCCCGVSTGAKIIAILGIIATIIISISSIAMLAQSDSYKNNQLLQVYGENGPVILGSLNLITGLVGLIINIALLYGVINQQLMPILAWLVIDMIGLLVSMPSYKGRGGQTCNFTSVEVSRLVNLQG